MTFFSSSLFVIDFIVRSAPHRNDSKLKQWKVNTLYGQWIEWLKTSYRIISFRTSTPSFRQFKMVLYSHLRSSMPCNALLLWYSRGRFDFVFFATFAVGTTRHTQSTQHSTFIEIHTRSRLLTVHYCHFIVEMFIPIRFFSLSCFHVCKWMDQRKFESIVIEYVYWRNSFCKSMTDNSREA